LLTERGFPPRTLPLLTRRPLVVQEYLVTLDVASLRKDAKDRMRARAAAALGGATSAP
jgi:hypothetical protein